MKLIILFLITVVYWIALGGMWATLNSQVWMFWFVIESVSLIAFFVVAFLLVRRELR